MLKPHRIKILMEFESCDGLPHSTPCQGKDWNSIVEALIEILNRSKLPPFLYIRETYISA